MTFPASYVGNYFFADLCGGWISRLDTVNGNAYLSFATGVNVPVDLLVTPAGDLLYLQIGDGSLRRVSFRRRSPLHAVDLQLWPVAWGSALDGSHD